MKKLNRLNLSRQHENLFLKANRLQAVRIKLFKLAMFSCLHAAITGAEQDFGILLRKNIIFEINF